MLAATSFDGGSAATTRLSRGAVALLIPQHPHHVRRPGGRNVVDLVLDVGVTASTNRDTARKFAGLLQAPEMRLGIRDAFGLQCFVRDQTDTQRRSPFLEPSTSVGIIQAGRFQVNTTMVIRYACRCGVTPSPENRRFPAVGLRPSIDNSSAVGQSAYA